MEDEEGLESGIKIRTMEKEDSDGERALTLEMEEQRHDHNFDTRDMSDNEIICMLREHRMMECGRFDKPLIEQFKHWAEPRVGKQTLDRIMGWFDMHHTPEATIVVKDSQKEETIKILSELATKVCNEQAKWKGSIRQGFDIASIMIDDEVKKLKGVE